MPADTNLESVRRKLAHDLYYARHMTPWLDVRIMLGTALNLLGIPADLTRALLRLPGGEAVENAYETRSAETLALPQVQPT